MLKRSFGVAAVTAAAALLLAACSSGSSDSAATEDTAAAAASGLACVILPDSASSPRWENGDRPALKEALEAAGFTGRCRNRRCRNSCHRRRHLHDVCGRCS